MTRGHLAKGSPCRDTATDISLSNSPKKSSFKVSANDSNKPNDEHVPDYSGLASSDPQSQVGSASNTDGNEEDESDGETNGKPHGTAPSTARTSTKTNVHGDAHVADAEQWMGLSETTNEHDTKAGTQETTYDHRATGRSRASSTSSTSSDVAVSDFDVPDDDDDYAALENVSNVSDDLHLEREESMFIRVALQADNAWDAELSNYEAAIDWNDEHTYQETPSGLYDDIMESHGMHDSPLSHISAPAASIGMESHRLLPPFGGNEIDPHLSYSLFRSISLTSDSSSSSSTEGIPLTPDETFPNTPDVLPGDSNDSDTEVEDMTEELAQRAELLEQRRKEERRRKKGKKRKPRSKSLDSESGALVLKKFPVYPKRPLAYTVTTPKGSVLRFTMPKSGNPKFRWVTGRTRPNPLELSPMTPAYANAMQGRLFQLYHCPNTPNLAPRGSKTMRTDFGQSSSFSNPGPYSVQRSFTASGGFSEAFFVDLDDASDDGDSYGIMDLLDLDGESNSGEGTSGTPTPLHSRSHSMPGRVLELDDDEVDFQATAVSSPSRYESPVVEDLPSSVMDVSPTATKRRFTNASDNLDDFEGPAPKRQSLHAPEVVIT